MNGLFNVLNPAGPYFSILVIIVLLLFVWVVWGSNERLIIEGAVGDSAVVETTSAPATTTPPAATFTLTPNTAGAQNAVLAINTTLAIKRDGILTLILPPEMEVPITNPTITPSAFGKVDSVSNMCDSDDLEKLLVVGIKKCNQDTVINIIMNTAALTDEQLKVAQPISFSITGVKLPSYASSLKFGITTSTGTSKSSTVSISGATGTAPAGGVDGEVSDCKFGITLSDDSPGAKLVTVNYNFSFTNGASGDLATFTIKKDKSKIYFLFSDDFKLPSVPNINVIVNKTTALSSEKGEYTLVYKQQCKSFVSDQLTDVLGLQNSFDSENKLCTNYYVLTLKKDLRVVSGELMISLSGITNPPYYSPPAAEGKRDYLVKPFNSSLCILNLDTTLVGGKYLMVPSPITIANAGIYFRGNYPIKNTGKDGDGDGDGDGASSGKSHVSSSSSTSRNHAANVYTVNYFYDGQGAGEYGHIAQPEIFGRAPYKYNSHKSGIMGSTSDAALAKHYNDYAKYTAMGQIAPQMGVAPSSLYGGVQPYNSEIHFK